MRNILLLSAVLLTAANAQLVFEYTYTFYHQYFPSEVSDWTTEFSYCKRCERGNVTLGPTGNNCGYIKSVVFEFPILRRCCGVKCLACLSHTAALTTRISSLTLA